MSYVYTLNKITITDAGIELLQRAIGGEELQFSSVAFGSGTPNNSTNYRSLVSERLRVPVRKVTSYSNKTIINSVINNSTITTGFDVKEIGIYAMDNNTEVLYAYGYFNPATDHISAYTETALEEVFEIEVYTSNATNITATIDSSLVYALASETYTKTEIDDMLEDISDVIENMSEITTSEVDNIVDTAFS